MSLLLLLFLCSLRATVAERTGYGSVAINTSFVLNYGVSIPLHDFSQNQNTDCPWRMAKNPGEDPPCVMEMASPAPNLGKDGQLNVMNGSETPDDQLVAHKENKAPFPIMVSPNSSSFVTTGLQYFFPMSLQHFVSMAQNVAYQARVAASISRDNGMNITLPYPVSHEYSSNKNFQKEALRHDELINHDHAFDEVVEHAIAAKNRLNYSDPMHRSTELSDLKLLTLQLLLSAIIPPTLWAIIELWTTVFTWVLEHKRTYLKIICILMLLFTNSLLMSYTSLYSILTIGKQQLSVKDVRNQSGVFRNGSLRGWNLKEGTEKNKSWNGDDIERFAKDRDSAAIARSEKTYKKLRVHIPFKYVVHNFVDLNRIFKGKQLIRTSFSVDLLKWVMATLPSGVSAGEFLSYENREYAEEHYDELIYQLYLKMNNSVSFEEFANLFVEHSRTKPIFRDGTTDMKLRILVPIKNMFPEFVKLEHDHEHNRKIVTGYSIEVFNKVMASLPYRVSYEFFPYENCHDDSIGCYDALIHQLQLNRYDGVVGDITITANRSEYGDFTQPYIMSGVSMIVPIVDNDITNSPWWFLKPFTLKLWLAIVILFLLKGILVRIFEHENQEFGGTYSEQVGKILCFSFSIFFFAQKEKLESNYSRLVINIWIFAVAILTITYAAMLQLMLSSDNNQPIVTDIEMLIRNGDYVGYQKGSALLEVLKNLGFQEQKLKAYASKVEYAKALSRGSDRNGVTAIIDEIPYIKIFLAEYGNRYAMAGPILRAGGFGFVFQRGSAIVPDISRAVLKFIEGDKMSELEKKWFGTDKPTPYPLSTPETKKKLSIYSFRGVLLIAEPASAVAIIIFIIVSIYKCLDSSRNKLNRNHINEGAEIEMIQSFATLSIPEDNMGFIALTRCNSGIQAMC